MSLARSARPMALALGLFAMLASAANETVEDDGHMVNEAEGTCTVGFETSSFRPRLDHRPTPMEAMEGNWWVSRWDRVFVGPPAPPGPGRSKPLRWTCRMTGWVSGPGRYGHMNMYSREFRVARSEFIPGPDSAP